MGKFNVAFECNMQPTASIWSPNFVHVIIINHCTSIVEYCSPELRSISWFIFSPFATRVRNIEKKSLLSLEQTFPTVFHLNHNSPRVCLSTSNLPFRSDSNMYSMQIFVKNDCLIVLNWICNWRNSLQQLSPSQGPCFCSLVFVLKRRFN